MKFQYFRLSKSRSFETFPHFISGYASCSFVFLMGLSLFSYFVPISFERKDYQFFIAVISTIVYFFPYLSRKSEYHSATGIILRPWKDNLITTSLVYFLPSLYATAVGEWHMAFLCAITCAGSTIYHRNREAMYFNMDNIFATSLLVSYCWSLYLAYGVYEAYFMFGMLGIPVAIFLLVYCGLPADIQIFKETLSTPFCCIRSDRPLYNSVHALWHLASGCGPLLSVWMFSRCAAQHKVLQSLLEISDRESMVMGSVMSIDNYGYMPLVPTVALLFGVLLNLTGNYFGVMPMK